MYIVLGGASDCIANSSVLLKPAIANFSCFAQNAILDIADFFWLSLVCINIVNRNKNSSVIFMEGSSDSTETPTAWFWSEDMV